MRVRKKYIEEQLKRLGKKYIEEEEQLKRLEKKYIEEEEQLKRLGKKYLKKLLTIHG